MYSSIIKIYNLRVGIDEEGFDSDFRIQRMCKVNIIFNPINMHKTLQLTKITIFTSTSSTNKDFLNARTNNSYLFQIRPFCTVNSSSSNEPGVSTNLTCFARQAISITFLALHSRVAV